MSIAQVEFYSPAQNQQVTYSIYLPDVGEGPYPVLLQLHGLSDSHRTWINHSNIVRHAAGYPMAIVFPDGGTGCYVNWKSAKYIGKRRYEDLIITDITNHLRRNFNVSEGPWAIGGLSMGGGGSMRLGLKYPDRFASIWSHSSKFEWDDVEGADEFEDEGCGAYARRLAASDGPRPVISFDCGVDDGLIDENRALHRLMTDLDIKHAYAEHPGDHTWDYWDEHVVAALAQHARVLGIERIVR